MKFELELDAELLREAERLAEEQQTTVSALIAQGIRYVLADPSKGSGKKDKK